jgi:hypothetical protein
VDLYNADPDFERLLDARDNVVCKAIFCINEEYKRSPRGNWVTLSCRHFEELESNVAAWAVALILIREIIPLCFKIVILSDLTGSQVGQAAPRNGGVTCISAARLIS